MNANCRMAACTLLATVISASAPAQDLSPFFTYQGQLKQNGAPMTGSVFMIARLFDAATDGTLLGQQGVGVVPVSNGLFTVMLNTGYEFGPTAFASDSRWLEFVLDGQVLAPRQKLTAAPFAVSAASLNGPIRQGNSVAYQAENSQGVLEDFLLPRWGNDRTYMTIGSAGLEVRTPGPAFSTRMHVSADGQLGIGTNAPNASFRTQIFGGSGVWKGGVAAGGSSANVVLGELNNVATIGGHNAALNGWANLAINSGGGFVGIGTTNPTSPLHVIPDANNNGIRIGRNDNGSQSVSIGLSGPGGLPYIQGVQSEGSTYGTLSLNPYGGNVRVRVLEITGGSDIAEPYDVATTDGADPQPGMIVSIDADQVGKLRLSTAAYDHTVAGIISGANGVNPGMMLTQKDTVADGKHPVAMTGRVWCWCDADASGPIQAGDLLTTSDTPGHAMKAADTTRASGAILGKAMSGLGHGKGLVLVLVSLQ